MPLYPLRFEPLLRRYLWGGRRLETLLGRQLPPGDDYAESWELCDRGLDQSVVAAGPLRGLTLREVFTRYRHELMGDDYRGHDRFPLLLKLIDAQRVLSVQVHPDDRRAARLTPPDLGKNEAWIVMHADPGSLIYAGLKAGCTRKQFVAALAAGHCEECLHSFIPQVGDCVYIPAGTVHALGAGIVITEIQQSSDVTYRLFDWNRLGVDGRPRALHLEAGLEAIDFQRGPVNPIARDANENDNNREKPLVTESFILSRFNVNGDLSYAASAACQILLVLAGLVTVEGDPAESVMRVGDSVLIPAGWQGMINAAESADLLAITIC